MNMWSNQLSTRILTAAVYVLPPLFLDIAFLSESRTVSDHPLCPPFDDVFIHYQYARSFAEGHPLRYHAGDPPTTGATSLLYPLLLALGWIAGLRDLALGIAAHLIAVASLALMMYSAKRLGDALLGTPGGIAAAIAALACPAFDFLAVSGMEVGAVAAAHVAAAVASVIWLIEPEKRDMRRAWWVAGLGVCAGLSRPESAISAACAGLVLMLFPPEGWNSARVLGLLPFLPIPISNLVAWATTDDPQTSGMIVKWIFADPYASREARLERVLMNWKNFWSRLIVGLDRTIPYPVLPSSFPFLFGVSFFAVAVSSVRRFRLRGVGALMILLATSSAFLFPITYTWAGNLGRYFLTYVPLWIIVIGLGATAFVEALLAALSRVIQTLARWTSRRAFLITVGALCGVWILSAFVISPSAPMRELGMAASQICEQHVAMAEKVRSLPKQAIVAVNDAGAIPYLGRHRTWDLVGLTSYDAARAWVAGPGSVFERLERLAPSDRPTHLAYYPGWFSGWTLGGALIAATESHGKHVGFYRKELREVRSELFDSGARPRLAHPEGRLIDELDVGDLDSERSHHYRNLGALRGSSLFREYGILARPVADGGRILFSEDSFEWHARPGRKATWILRTDAWYDTNLEIFWNGAPLEPLTIDQSRTWVEIEINVPAERVREFNHVVRRLAGFRDVALFHDWLYQ